MNASPTTPLHPWTFDELVREGVALIPAYAPAWTDHNPSDPGITLVELLAFFAEAFVYRLSRVTPEARLEFLRLLRGAHWSGWRQLQGAPGAMIDAALDQAVRELGQCECAITVSDFEALAMEAAREALGSGSPVQACCFAGVDLERTMDSARTPDTRAHVTVVVLPREELDAEAIARLCALVRERLAPRCLLTTRLHVVGPLYLHLGFGARIALRPGADRRQVHAAIDANLQQRVGPWGGDARAAAADAPSSTALIRLGDITGVIDATEGVDYVEDVFVSTLGTRAAGLSDASARVGVQVGIHSRPGVDARLGVITPTGAQRLQRDDAGRLAAILLQPWEVARLEMVPESLAWIDAQAPGPGPAPASGEASDEA
jgi:hypothetical protein